MHARLSFRTRLLISIWVILIAALFVPAWYNYNDLSEEMLSEAQTDAVRHMNGVHRMLGEAEPFFDVGQMQEWMKKVGEELGVRITYMTEGGKVIADSKIPLSQIPDIDSFSSRPEILQTRDEEIGLSSRFSKALKAEQIFAARKIGPRGAIPGGVLRVAVDYSNSRKMLDELRNTYFFLFALIVLATPLLSILFIRQLGDPIRSVVGAIEAVGNKNFKQRLRFNPAHEFYPLAWSFNRMAENIDEQIQLIEEQQQRLETVFNGMQEGVMVLDSRGKIQSINHALSRLIPNPSQAPGRRPLEVIMNLELQEACDRVVSPSAGETADEHSLVIRLDSERIYDVNIVGLTDHGKGMGAVVVFHDISELKRLERVRQDFMANVSHELRTPLTSIKGYTETLLGGAIDQPGAARPFLEIILKHANHMAKMVGDLLQLARLEAPKPPLEPAPSDAAEALSEALKACLPLARARDVNLKSDLGEGVLVLADFDQFVQVFRNLLENAIRYSPIGETVSVSCRPQRDSIRFGVRDKGPGIAGQHQQRVFERFYRVEKHRGSESGSTGLGLAICRHIVRNHGGTIWIQSPNNDDLTGTTIYFTLPQALLRIEELKS